jgi:beta-ureidopropionase / N-carbamoyl-L-amino-acid hydrolase
MLNDDSSFQPQGFEPSVKNFGMRIMALAERLAAHSEIADGLTCTYLSPAHRAVAAELADWMRAAGMDVHMDAVGNVIGRYASAAPDAKTFIIASHYDTVRNGGKYDGRLGILCGLVVIERLKAENRRLPFHLELIAFSEEEGVRFATPFIGSAPLAGRFDPALLDLRDAEGVRLGDLMRETGLEPGGIPELARRPADLLGLLEVHIEQGPVLLRENLPVGIVTAIAGGVRYLVTVTGKAGHAGTVPMSDRHDAATAAAEIVLYVERRCAQAPTLVGTVGQFAVPGGAINVIPGLCRFSIDIRAADDATRDAAVADVLAEIARIADRRGVAVEYEEMLRKPAVVCSARLRDALRAAVESAGIDVFTLPSGAGHDAMMFYGVTDIGMLFVRCGNEGISHHPLETITADDADTAARVVLQVLAHLAQA